ncbi:MAG: hypothetical protein Q7T47_03520 [Anaerolineales bacterium]|nr:hypothetical protein [Anaerolineales bacterium]
MKRNSVIFIILILLTTACAVAPEANRPWAYADLRRLDPPDDAPTHATDILAVYTRISGYDLQIRLDLLDLTFADNYLVEIHLWDNTHYAQSPLIIQIPAMGANRLIQPAGVDSPLRVRSYRNPSLDTITIAINRIFIGERYHFDIYTYLSPADSPADQALDIRSDDPPPLGRAPLLLAFTDSYAAYTPAQAMRRWDGAHTGPTGERHGLRNVLDNAERYGIPVALLDLKTPTSLSALDFMGKIDQIQRMAARRLLILPDVAYGEPADVSLTFSREAAHAFGLPASPFVYAPFSNLLPAYLYQFTNLPTTNLPSYQFTNLPTTDLTNNPTHLARRAGTTLIPIPIQTDVQAADNGLSLNVRKLLIQTALSPDAGDIVVLGGSLPNSTWGDSDISTAAFAYIAAHPWLWALNGEDLLSFPVGAKYVSPPPPTPATPSPIYTTQGQETNLDSAALQSRLLSEFHKAPENPLTDSAWQMYFALTAPTEDTRLQSLRAQYLGGVGGLLAASRWAENPEQQAGYAFDLDYDGQNECLLVSSKYFAVVETDGARLTLLFSRDESGVHQLIGHTAQFAVGISDPSEWKATRGEAAEPAQIMGAFSDTPKPFENYTPTWTSNDTLILTGTEVRRVKTFRLTESGLEIRYYSKAPLSTRIPIAIDPWKRFHTGWESEIRADLSPNGWTWGLADGTRLEVRTEAPFSAQGITVSIPFLSQAENPNLDYPAGHFYPFPLSVMEIQANGDFTILLSLP